MLVNFSPSSRKSKAGASQSLEALKSRGKERMQVVVQHRPDLCMPICNALSLPDLILECSVTVAGVRLPRGMQLVAPKSTALCKATRSKEALLQGLQKMMKLTFTWPEHLEEEPDFMTWWWKCPHCRFPYPVQAPEALTGVSLLRRALPGIEEFIDGPARDLWSLSSLSLPAQKPSEHVLREFNNSFGVAGQAQCSSCGEQLGSIVCVCQLCGLFVCQVCEKQRGPLCCPPGPAEGKAGVSYKRLSGILDGRFDLSPVLDFGSLDRFMTSETPLAVAAAQRLLQRKGGVLEPLKSPYEYYARAALLQVRARRAAEERFQLLQEACVALQDCMAAPGCANNLYSIEGADGKRGDRARPQRSMAKDPRVWYLLGLLLCDLGSFEEARKAYRQALCRLPMYYFSHVVHFNLALLRSRDADAGACAASASALRELRRCCGSGARNETRLRSQR